MIIAYVVFAAAKAANLLPPESLRNLWRLPFDWEIIPNKLAVDPILHSLVVL